MNALHRLGVIVLTVLTCGLVSFTYFLHTGYRPWGVAFDGKGAMYMVTAPDIGSGALWRVTPEGKAVPIATLHGTFIGPGIATDGSGNAFITVGNKLLKVSPKGRIQTVAESFSNCIDVKLDHNGNFYVADDGKKVVCKITPSGSRKVIYSSNATGSLLLTAICVDRLEKKMYVRDGNKILRLSLDPGTNSQKPDVILENPKIFYMCIDDEDNIYVDNDSDVIKISSAGKTSYLASSVPTPVGLAIGGKGFNAHTLFVSSPSGIVELPTGSDVKGKSIGNAEGFPLRMSDQDRYLDKADLIGLRSPRVLKTGEFRAP